MSSWDGRAWMWAEALQTLDRAERMHRQFFRPRRATTGAPAWEPPVDIFETAEHLVIITALPGIAPEDIRISANEGALVVVGERRTDPSLRDAAIRRLELPYGWFERRIDLPSGRFEIKDQALAHGCLTIILRKLMEGGARG